VARNRQRAKQRQAERRARRVAQGDSPGGTGGGQARAGRSDALADPTVVEPSPAVDPQLAAGAPPQDEGSPHKVLAAEQAEEEALVELDEAELGDGDGAAPEAYSPRGRRGREREAPAGRRGRFVQFLIAVWAELQRVQWPNRQALTTLTGVVLGFVLIAGGYLGLLDAIWQPIINYII
jgi:preprotein translocase SecE subunit